MKLNGSKLMGVVGHMGMLGHVKLNMLFLHVGHVKGGNHACKQGQGQGQP